MTEGEKSAVPVPVITSVTVDDDNHPIIKWTGVDGAEKYEIYCKKDGENDYTYYNYVKYSNYYSETYRAGKKGEKWSFKIKAEMGSENGYARSDFSEPYSILFSESRTEIREQEDLAMRFCNARWKTGAFTKDDFIVLSEATGKYHEYYGGSSSYVMYGVFPSTNVMARGVRGGDSKETIVRVYGEPSAKYTAKPNTFPYNFAVDFEYKDNPEIKQEMENRMLGSTVYRYDYNESNCWYFVFDSKNTLWFVGVNGKR